MSLFDIMQYALGLIFIVASFFIFLYVFLTIIDIVKSEITIGKKIMWFLVVVIFTVLGALAWNIWSKKNSLV